MSSNKVEKICLLRLLSGNHRDKTFFFFQPQLSSTPLPAVLAAWRLSWSMDTSKAKRKHIIEESIAHWTFCCRLLYIKLLRQKCSGMLLERWIGETFSKMYVKTCSSVLYSSVAIYFIVQAKTSRFLRILLWRVWQGPWWKPGEFTTGQSKSQIILFKLIHTVLSKVKAGPNFWSEVVGAALSLTCRAAILFLIEDVTYNICDQK